MKRTIALGVAGIVLAGSAAPGLADELVRRGGAPRIAGSITNVSKTEVTIKPATREAETVPANEILRARWDGEPPGLNLGRGREDSGNLAEALRAYQEALGALPSGNAALKAEVEYLIARTTARIALADPQQLDEAVKKLDAWRKAHPNHFRFYESLDWQGQAEMARGNLEPARSLFDQMGQAPWNDYKMAARIGGARVLMKQEKHGEALQAFEAVVGMAGSGAADLSRQLEAQLGRATCLAKQQQHADAVKTLEEIVHKVPAGETSVQAEGYLRLGDSLQAMGKSQEALLAYLHVDVLFARETAQHAEALYHLSRLWNTAGHPGRAGEAAARLQADYPNSEWARRLAGG